MNKARNIGGVAELCALESRRLLSTVLIPKAVAITETNATVKDSFTVALNKVSTAPTKVSISTKNVTAKTGVDYVATTKTITIPAGKLTGTFTIPVRGNKTYDGNRSFLINYSTSTNGAKLSRKSEIVTIKDDEAIPQIIVNDVSITEGNAGRKNALVTATLSGPSSLPIMVGYKTSNDTAIAGKDYVATKNVLKFTPKQTSASFKIPINGNTVPDVDKVIDVNFTSSTHSVLPSFSRVVIQDDDHGVTRQQANINVAAVPAGDRANFVVTLQNASTTTVSIRYNTVARTATSADFQKTTGVVKFSPGQTSKTVSINTFVNPAATNGGNRTFDLVLSAPANATLLNDHATAVIIEPITTTNGGGTGSNPLVSLSVSNPAAAESSAGQANTLDFEIDLDGPSDNVVTVNYTTLSDSGDPAAATAGVDYMPISGVISFQPHVTKQIISVTILPSGLAKGQVKHVELDLSNATNASLDSPEGIGAIIGTA